MFHITVVGFEIVHVSFERQLDNDSDVMAGEPLPSINAEK
jgi:hypothetical protein